MAQPMGDHGHGEAGNGAANGGANGAHRLNWTPAMSGFMLRRFAQLVAEGVRTDKGFKDVHVTQVANQLSEFTGQHVVTSQVHNHLRKWRTKWTKICRLKDLSGAGWDEDLCMITLEQEHYNGHVKDHPKDAEYLNVPLVNYNQMQTIFANGVATGRFAMGSSQPLGTPAEQEAIDVPDDAPQPAKDEGGGLKNEKKRKRVLNEDDQELLHGITDAIYGLGAAVSEGNNSEAAPGIYNAVMELPGFARVELMKCLNFLTKQKASALVFLEMTPEDKELWCRMHLEDSA